MVNFLSIRSYFYKPTMNKASMCLNANERHHAIEWIYEFLKRVGKE